MTIIILYHVEGKKKNFVQMKKKNLHTYNIIIQLTY